MTDQELITAVAKNVMGWPVLDRPVENNDTGETVFFWDEDKPVVAKAYETSAQMRSHGACNYGYMWHKWNPLTDPAAMFDVINAIAAKGTWITMTIDAKETICSIGLKGFHTQATTPGMALCRAAIQWAEANQIESSANTDMLGILQEFMRTRWPDGARYAAIDYNGNVFCYMNKPTTHQTVWITADPGTVIQTGWLAIEDGADWKKLIVDRPADQHECQDPAPVGYTEIPGTPDELIGVALNSIANNLGWTPEERPDWSPVQSILDQMLKLSTNLAPEYRWIATDESGRTWGFKRRPTPGSTCWFDGGQYKIAGRIEMEDNTNWKQLIIDRQPAPDSVSYAHQIKA